MTPVKRYAIMRIPGPAALRRSQRSGRVLAMPRPRRVDTFDASGDDKLALAVYALRHFSQPHAQYQCHRFVWVGEQAALSGSPRWRADDGRTDVRGRTWRMLVTLHNGAHIHEAAFEAWQVAR